MVSVTRRGLVLLALSLVVAGTASASEKFDFRPLSTYTTVPVTEDLVEFRAVLKSDLVGGDAFLVEYDVYAPDGWFSQFCQTSTGICYFDDAVVEVRNDSPDTLRIDFFTPPGEPGVGFADIRVSRVNDPLDYALATFTVGLGVQLPIPSFNFINLTPPFHQGNPGDLVEFFSQLRSNNNYPDQLIVTPFLQMPGDWFAQFCQTSTGTCYFERATVPLGAFMIDSLRVDFFTGPNPGVGNMQIRVQSASNPSIWKMLPFRVRTGSIPSSVDNASDGSMRTSIAPNPLDSRAVMSFVLPDESPVRLLLTNADGRVVMTRSIPLLPAGAHQMDWDVRDTSGRPLPSGTYFYRLDATGASSTGKVVVSR